MQTENGLQSYRIFYPLTAVHSSELDRKINSDPIPSPASPSIQKLFPIIELEDKQASEIDDDQQLERQTDQS